MSRRVVFGCLSTAVLLAGCSSQDAAVTPTSAMPQDSTVSTTAVAAPSCDLGTTGDLGPVSAVEGTTNDWTVTSFDGTEIRAHWFATDATSGQSAPTVLMGPGWSLAGETSMEGSPIFGSLGIGRLLDAGYNVLTWDPRGFGASGGEVNVDSAELEGRDVQVLLDWVSAQDGVLTDAEGDPRVGMIGASYGGGIQLVTAAIDCRVDAIVPNMAWNSLTSSLYRNDTFKQGWGTQLTTFAAAAALDPHITDAAEQGRATATLSPENVEWFAERGPGELVGDIAVPTLLLGGTVDTLFTLDETIENYRLLDDAGTQVSMMWYCGGHGVCLSTPNPDLAWMADATVAWLDRWVKGDESVDLGDRIIVVDQHDVRFVADDFEVSDETVSVTVDAPGVLDLAETTQDPIVAPAGDILGGIVSGITPARAHRAVEVSIIVDAETLLIGPPSLTLSYRGTIGDGERPTRMFAQLVDSTTGLVLGGQVTPIPLTLDGTEQRVEVALESIAHSLKPGDELTLQLIATTPAYALPRLGGSVEVTSAAIELPIAEGFRAG